MIYALLTLSLVACASLGALVVVVRQFGAERQQMRKEMALERGTWVQERRDLNNRIQVPEAAPYIQVDAEPSDDDLPELPGRVMTEEEMERAKAELASVGYEEGPVG